MLRYKQPAIIYAAKNNSCAANRAFNQMMTLEGTGMVLKPKHYLPLIHPSCPLKMLPVLAYYHYVEMPNESAALSYILVYQDFHINIHEPTNETLI